MLPFISLIDGVYGKVFWAFFGQKRNIKNVCLYYSNF